MTTENAIPLGLCQCGCGNKTAIAPWSIPSRGWIKGEHVRFKLEL